VTLKIEREMDFTISRSQSGFTEKEKENLDKLGEKECVTEGVISRQLQKSVLRAWTKKLCFYAYGNAGLTTEPKALWRL